MALKPLRRIRRQKRTVPYPVQSPTGGLNRRDALASMPTADAYVLDNWFPATDAVETRKGFVAHNNISSVNVPTLIPYIGASGSKLLAVSNGDLKDVTSVGAPTTVSAAAFPNDSKVQFSPFTNAANYWLVMVNGADAPRSYDGAVSAALTITGVTGGQTKLVDVFSFKGRLYFAAVGQAGFYYLPVGNIQGAASYFDLGQISGKGGNLRAITSISKDSGDGPDDYIVFIMDSGEYLVYAGFDPSSATNWTLVGRYFIAPPIGRRCHCKYGGDALVLTETGLVSLLAVMDGGQFNPDEDTLTRNLGSALNDFVVNKDTHGWQVVVYPFADMLILNVPVGSTTGFYYQYIMNTKTRKWCRYIGWNGQSWAVLGTELYFGDYAGNVRKANQGYDDNGTPIRCDARQAYTILEEAQLKQFHMVRLVLASISTPAVSVGVNTDFKDKEPNYSSAPSVGNSSLWDVSSWDVALWGTENGVNYVTRDINELGFAGSVNVRVEVKGDQVRWFATMFFTEKGGLLGDST